MRDDSLSPSDGSVEQGEARVALIAGAGRFPIGAASELRTSGKSVVAIGFHGLSVPGLEAEVSEMHWFDLGQIIAVANALREARVSRILLIGKIPKTLVFSDPSVISLDAEAMRLVADQKDRSDDGWMARIAEWLEGQGFELLDQKSVLAPMLVPTGVLTRSGPSRQAEADLDSGWPILEALGPLGVGQCVVVREGVVLAIEALEGTDEAIRRGGEWGGKGATVIKAMRSAQDCRFDLPAVGPDTIRTMARVGAQALAVEAGATLMLDREGCIAEADRAGIAIWGFDSGRGPV